MQNFEPVQVQGSAKLLKLMWFAPEMVGGNITPSKFLDAFRSVAHEIRLTLPQALGGVERNPSIDGWDEVSPELGVNNKGGRSPASQAHQEITSQADKCTLEKLVTFEYNGVTYYINIKWCQWLRAYVNRANPSDIGFAVLRLVGCQASHQLLRYIQTNVGSPPFVAPANINEIIDGASGDVKPTVMLGGMNLQKDAQDAMHKTGLVATKEIADMLSAFSTIDKTLGSRLSALGSSTQATDGLHSSLCCKRTERPNHEEEHAGFDTPTTASWCG
jgi:hypothetical protein